MQQLWFVLLAAWLVTGCPENEVYTACSSSSCFEPTCGRISTLLCTKDCKAGCKCLDGFARNGSACIPQSDCPEVEYTGDRRSLHTGFVGVLRMVSAPERCLMADLSELAPMVKLSPCDRRTDLQVDASESGVIRLWNKPELCLTSNSSTAITAGDPVMLTTCVHALNQQFQFNRYDGSIRSTEKPLCFGAKNVVVSLVDCMEERSQKLELFDNGCFGTPTAPITDFGANDAFRGWYDVQWCGTCRDYCRWVGSGSGGDPALGLVRDSSHWSCALAGSVREFTLPGYFQEWNYTKCDIISPFGVPDSLEEPVPFEALPTVPRRVTRRAPTVAPSLPRSQQPTQKHTQGFPNISDANVTANSQVDKSTVPVNVTQDSAIPLGILGCLLLLGGMCCLAISLWEKKAKGDPERAVADGHVSCDLEDSVEPGRSDAP